MHWWVIVRFVDENAYLLRMVHCGCAVDVCSMRIGTRSGENKAIITAIGVKGMVDKASIDNEPFTKTRTDLLLPLFSLKARSFDAVLSR